MNLALRPATIEALDQFRRRRQLLLLVRAGLGFLTLAVACFLVIALLDRAWFMPETVRPWVTLAVYAAGAILAWRIALRYIGEAREDHGAARLLEAAAPSLHEKLLAAVELAQPAADATVPDSAEFRARLQEDVAGEVGRLNLKQALPARSIKPWLLRVLGLAVVIGGLSFVPQLHLPGFLARAALPFANLKRPSSVEIEVVKPALPVVKAPFASEVELVVDVTGKRPDKVQLEVADGANKPQRIELGQATIGRFEGRIAIGQGDVRYRVRAADGITPWRVIEARPRPVITHFVKTVVPPVYTGLPETRIEEDHGDLEALDGSEVKVVMTANQAVKKAEAVLNPDVPEPPAAPKVELTSPTELRTTVAVREANHSWTVRLTAEETGFRNDEVSPWRITSIADLPPIAVITEPAEQQELLPDETLRIAGTASDDVGLASVALATSVNGGGWEEKPLASKPGKESTLQHLLLLGPLGLKPGDSLLAKLVAVDLRGQRAESEPLRIIILEQTVDPRQRAWADAQRRLARTAKTLNDKVGDLKEAASKVQKGAKLARSGKEPDEAANQLARMHEALEQSQETASDLWNQLKEAAREAPNALAAQEARLLGEKLAQLRHESLAALAEAAQKPIEQTDTMRRDASAAAVAAMTLERAASTFAAEAAARVAERAGSNLKRQEQLLTENSLQSNRDSSARPRWQEQQRAALAAADGAMKDMQSLEQTLPGGQQRAVEQARQQITEAARDLNDSLDKPGQTKSPEHLYGASDNLRQRFERAGDVLRGMVDFTSNQAAQMRQSLSAATNPALTALELGKAALAEAAAKAADTKKPAKPDRDGRMPADKAKQELAKAAQQLQDQGDLRQQTPQLNSEAASGDLNHLSRAADKLARQAGEAGAKKDAAALSAARDRATQLAEAARMLEADAQAQAAANALNTAADPAAQAMMPATDRSASAQTTADEARAAAEQLRELPKSLRSAKAASELAQAAQDAANEANAAADQANEARRQQMNQPSAPNAANAPAPAVPHLAEAQAKAAAVAERIQEQAAAARQSLAALTPQVSEMMRDLASDLRGTQSETQNAAKDAEQNKPLDQVAQQAQNLQPKTSDNAKRMDSLQAALRQEANQADLAKADQRQLSRTADVALEQMRQKSPQIAQNLRQAMQASASQPQAQALQNAANAQAQTADALEQLAQNFQQMEQGKEVSEEMLAALKDMEKQLGVEEPLDEAYNRAEDLAKMAQDANEDPQKVLAELEKELPRNPSMQKALAEMAKGTAQNSEQQVTEKSNQPAMLGLAAELAAHDLARVARHQQRLGDNEDAQKVAQASAELQKTAAETKPNPIAATPEKGQQAAQQAQQASQAAEQTASKAPLPATSTVFEQMQGALLAQALDQLDQTLHPMQTQMPGQDQQQQQSSSRQGAQQSLDQAQQSQQQAMAQARNQGQVPGSKKGQQQQANKQAQPDSPPQSQEGGNFNQKIVDGVLGEQMVLVDGDWGHLPSRMAKDLTEATRQDAAPEYRAAIESYYKAIATKSKQN